MALPNGLLGCVGCVVLGCLGLSRWDVSLGRSRCSGRLARYLTMAERGRESGLGQRNKEPAESLDGLTDGQRTGANTFDPHDALVPFYPLLSNAPLPYKTACTSLTFPGRFPYRCQ